MSDDLGPLPTPHTEPKEPNPGGVDAIDAEEGPPAVHDLGADENPAIEEVAPDEIKQLEDTEDGANTDGASEPEKESPA